MFNYPDLCRMVMLDKDLAAELSVMQEGEIQKRYRAVLPDITKDDCRALIMVAKLVVLKLRRKPALSVVRKAARK